MDSVDIEDLGPQYLNYAIKNYDKIKNKEFPMPIERMRRYSYNYSASERWDVTAKYQTDFKCLPSMDGIATSVVKNNVWELDPEMIEDSIHNSETIDEYHDQMIEEVNWGKVINIIE